MYCVKIARHIQFNTFAPVLIVVKCPCLAGVFFNYVR